MLDLGKLLISVNAALMPKVVESTTIIETIERALEEERSDGYVSRRFSPGGYVCARWKAHERLNNFEPRMDDNEADTLKLFKAGTGIHDIIQQSVLAATRNLFGDWECASCGFSVSNSVRPEAVCQHTRTSTDKLKGTTVERCADVLARKDQKWKYKEKYFISNPLDAEDYEISGYSDGIWLMEDGSWRVLEVKSSDALTFDNQYRTKHPDIENGFILKPASPRHPMQDHINQGMVYGKMALDEAWRGDLPLNPTLFKGLIILYVCRNTFRMKEYHVEYSSGPYEDLKMLATIAKKAVDESNAFLATPRCTNKTNVLAKRCPLRDQCFPKVTKAKKK